jgi:hypothetical protein
LVSEDAYEFSVCHKVLVYDLVTAFKVASTRKKHESDHSKVEIEHHTQIFSEHSRAVAKSHKTGIDLRIGHLQLEGHVIHRFEKLCAIVPAKVSEEVPNEIPLQDSAHEAFGKGHEEGWRLHINQEQVIESADVTNT